MTTKEASTEIEQVTSQLSAHIWGHRFKDGQRGPEYVLEFLNVLYGTDYCFSKDEYSRRRSVGLRKFIFEGVKEGSSDGSILVLTDKERQRLLDAVHENDVHILRQFLGNLEVVLYNTTGKEADRSWYAKTLYPLHESLLYAELRKTGKESYSFEHNFFARGGELYFLMLAHGTEGRDKRRQFIEARFKQLLTKNKAIEKVTHKIISAISDEESRIDKPAQLRSTDEKKSKPYLPEHAHDENKALFESFADELERLLAFDLDIYEMFHLLVSLICFQLDRYIHERAVIEQESYTYFFDCLDGGSNPILQLSAKSYEQRENIIKNKLELEFEKKYQRLLDNVTHIDERLVEWKHDPEVFFKEMGISNLKSRKKTMVVALKRCNHAADVAGHLKVAVREVVSEQLKKSQLSITRVLSRDGGFATYRRGSASNYRYTISDSFLQILVFTKVSPKEKMEYYEFLDALYQDYGIVIGENEAKKSGLYTKSKLNVRHFHDNEKALRAKLRNNGLLIEFSDATAMVRNPYSCAKEVDSSYA